jgi:hypothetical protein
MSTDYRALCAELHTAVQLYTGQNPAAAETPANELVARLMAALAATAAALAQPEPQGPTLAHEAYVAFVQICKGNSDDAGTYEADEELVRRALKRLSDLEMGHPAIEPVPVSERLPGAEDCDARGWCWYWHPGEECWEMVPVVTGTLDEWTHWLPHHALPLPTPTP